MTNQTFYHYLTDKQHPERNEVFNAMLSQPDIINSTQFKLAFLSQDNLSDEVLSYMIKDDKQQNYHSIIQKIASREELSDRIILELLDKTILNRWTFSLNSILERDSLPEIVVKQLFLITGSFKLYQKYEIEDEVVLQYLETQSTYPKNFEDFQAVWKRKEVIERWVSVTTNFTEQHAFEALRILDQEVKLAQVLEKHKQKAFSSRMQYALCENQCFINSNVLLTQFLSKFESYQVREILQKTQKREAFEVICEHLKLNKTLLPYVLNQALLPKKQVKSYLNQLKTKQKARVAHQTKNRAVIELLSHSQSKGIKKQLLRNPLLTKGQAKRMMRDFSLDEKIHLSASYDLSAEIIDLLILEQNSQINQQLLNCSFESLTNEQFTHLFEGMTSKEILECLQDRTYYQERIIDIINHCAGERKEELLTKFNEQVKEFELDCPF